MLKTITLILMIFCFLIHGCDCDDENITAIDLGCSIKSISSAYPLWSECNTVWWRSGTIQNIGEKECKSILARAKFSNKDTNERYWDTDTYIGNIAPNEIKSYRIEDNRILYEHCSDFEFQISFVY